MRAAKAVKDLSEANIGIIGHVFRGMYDLELSKTFFKNTFGANVIQIQSSHLLDAWKEVDKNEVDITTLTSRFEKKNVTDDDIFRSLHLAKAMEKIVDKFSLDAMCFLDQHFVQKQVLTSARMGASLIMENTDKSVNCEGDLAGLVVMMLMRSISGKAALMGEWGEYDEDKNAVFVIGHGIGTPDMAADESKIKLCRTPEEWGFEGAGLNYELIMKPGKATLAHIMEGPNGYRMIISSGENVQFPCLNFDELHALFAVKQPVKEYLEKVFTYGVSHHCIVGQGDMAEELEIVADLLGIDVFRID
jgi:L-fucose isomerase-like protein